MTQSARSSVRSLLIAGVSAAVVGTVAVQPATAPALAPARTVNAAVQLSAALAPLLQPAAAAVTTVTPPPAAAATASSPVGAAQAAAVTSGVENFIKTTYNAVEPWVAWGFQLGQWALGFVPIAWWFAPAISLGYYTIEPLVQAGVYAFADVLGLNFSQIGPDVRQGIQQSAQNAWNYSLAWIGSLVPLPPPLPFPPRPGILAARAAGATRPAAALAAPASNDPAAGDNAASVDPPTALTAGLTTKARGARTSARASRPHAIAVTAPPAAAAESSPTDPSPAETTAADAAPAPQIRKAPARGGGHLSKAARTAARAG